MNIKARLEALGLKMTEEEQAECQRNQEITVAILSRWGVPMDVVADVFGQLIDVGRTLGAVQISVLMKQREADADRLLRQFIEANRGRKDMSNN